MIDPKYNEVLALVANKVQGLPVTDPTRQTVAEEINIFIRAFNNLINDVSVLEQKLAPKIRHLRWEIADTINGEASPFVAIVEIEVNDANLLPDTDASWTSSGYYNNDATRKPYKVADGDYTYETGTFVGSNGQKTNVWLQVDLGSVNPCKEWRIRPSTIDTQPKNIRVYGSALASPGVKTINVTHPDWQLISTVTLPSLTGAWSQFYPIE